MGGSQSQEPAEAPGGTSPAKSPAKAAPAAPAPEGSEKQSEPPTGTSPAESPAKAAPAAPAAPAPGGSKTSKTAALPAGLVAPAPATGGSQICVRNLPKDAKDEDLRKLFKGFGKITDVSIKTFENGEGKGYGFITFKKPEEAKKAIEAMHEKPEQGKPLLVTMAAHQPGQGKGKGKDGGDKGKGTGKVSKTAALPAGLVGVDPRPSAAAEGEGGKKPKKEVPGSAGSQICVRNLSKDVKEEDLRKQFKGFGKITDVSIKTFENGQGKGYGFITFKKLEEAQKAIEGMHEKPQPEGKPLLVTMGTRQPGEGKGKGKDGGEKGKGKGKGGKGKGEAKGQYPYGDYPYSQEQGKPLSLTMATSPPGDGGEKGKGKGKGDGQQNAQVAPYQYPYGYPYAQDQVQAWAMQMQYYQQAQQAQAQQAQQALQAQAYYRGLTGGVIIPRQAAISSASYPAPAWEGAAPAAPAATAASSDTVYTGQVKSISNKNGYGFIACSETKALYSRDVFVDATLLPDIQVNSKVNFTVELSQKGHPRASKVVKLPD